MKILHTADIHLGVKNIKLSIEKQVEIRNEQNLQIKELFSRAYDEDYDVVLICGDLFHSKSVQSKIIANFFDAVKDFSRPVLYIKGNHDEKLDFKAIKPENFIVLDDNNPCYIINNVVFWGQVDPKIIKENYNNSQKNILLLHGDYQKKTSNDYVDINSYLNNFKFDYIAMGHVHNYTIQELYGTKIAYPGSLFSNGFDESGEKGYLQINIENQIDIAFIPFSKRKYCVCSCDVSNMIKYHDILNNIKEELKGNNAFSQDLVRIILTGYCEEESEKYLDMLKKDLSNYYYVEIIDNTKLRIDFDKIKKEELSFKAEFLLLVENSEEDDNIKNKISQIGIEALRGDDISI